MEHWAQRIGSSGDDQQPSRLSPWSAAAPVMVGLVLSIASLFLGSWDAAWAMFPIPPQLRTSFTWTLGVIFLLAGFLYSALDIMNRAERAMASAREDILREMHAIGGDIRRLDSDRAFDELCKRLPTVRAIWNTRISTRSPSMPYPSASGRRWRKTLVSRVSSGTVTYREVMDASWIEHVRLEYGQIPALAVFSFLDMKLPSFQNFIILESATGKKELYLGWAISRNRGLEQSVFHISDPAFCEHFLSWHNELFSWGEEIDS